MAANSLRPYVAEIIVDPIAKIFIKIGISPNTLSIVSCIFSIFAGVFYYIAGDDYFGFQAPYYFLLVAAICVLINSGLDALDGAVARLRGIAGKKGDFLDHVIDRYADVFIISGIIFGGFCPWWIGYIALVGVLLTSYLGTQAQAMDIGRYYGGIMGRADRLIIILIATFLDFGYIFINGHPAAYGGFCFLGWSMIIIAIGSHITAFQRIYHIWKALDKEDKAAAAESKTET
ncbi:Phosphatidylinositol phosphate synthase [Methanimicrococcus hongohii]|uniref:Phosphatidylinositol phosphate synthase n=1 Tax=Methanimicrococcus hongohii TaxID=3028295 RepID=A0AA97A2C5_9EURY|nr:CDP-alcohol phosphatidyltransferase family protein [Methanimicrococcus sp. Hf6]WNY23978.1 Phosphatidylinositol phosphate synthase [Methanimicrococcus sp. Hf6]